MFPKINHSHSSEASKAPKMEILSKLLVTLHPHRAPFVDNMQRSKQKVKKKPFFCLASSRAKVGAPQEPSCSLGAGSVLLRSSAS